MYRPFLFLFINAIKKFSFILACLISIILLPLFLDITKLHCIEPRQLFVSFFNNIGPTSYICQFVNWPSIIYFLLYSLYIVQWTILNWTKLSFIGKNKWTRASRSSSTVPLPWKTNLKRFQVELTYLYYLLTVFQNGIDISISFYWLAMWNLTYLFL